MKKLVALPLAVLFAAACSESTAPAKTSDLTPSYSKPVSGGVAPATGTLYTDSYDFNGSIGVLAAAHSGIGTDTYDGTLGTSASDIQTVPNDVTNGFIGRFNNVATRVLLNATTAGSKYSVNFDLYVIGSWDGKGKQAQNGTFLANVFQVGYRCSVGGTVTPIFTTTFSNQLTVQQDFPQSFGLGGNKAASGASAIDALDYKDHPELSNTPVFRSFGDVTYNLTYTVGDVCGGTAPTFVFSSTAPGQQSNYDESWGMDNIHLYVDA